MRTLCSLWTILILVPPFLSSPPLQAQSVIEFVSSPSPKPSPTVSLQKTLPHLSPEITYRFEQAAQLLRAVCTLITPRPASPTLTDALGKLEIANCPSISGEDWFKYLLYKKLIDLTPEFQKGCDLDGRVRMTHSSFEGEWKVRNLPPLEKITLTLNLELQKIYETNQFDAVFKISNGRIFSHLEKAIFFEGECKVITPAQTGEHLPGSEGILKILRLGENPMDFLIRFPL